MDKNSVACAMEWSIELEKALRSKIPGRSFEAILKTGERLEQWSREPEPTMVVYKMFGLVPGEDRLFANTILLRLADAFRLGDKDVRLSVVRIFLSEHKQHRKKKKHKQNGEIWSKARVANHLELLRRVKVVFDNGDLESRALALVLFGCWADFAKDSAHIRYLILSSMVSSDELEVKASLFAAGCFCELVNDFALVVLEMLVNMVNSPEVSLAVRLAGVKVFSRMTCSCLVANRAYKTGLKLLLDSSEEDLLVGMLASLSNLSSKSSVLISEQLDLLLSFLSREKSLRLQEVALRCLHFIFIKGVYHSPSASLIKTLSSLANDAELPLAMQCEILQILHKMLLYTLPSLPSDCTPEFSHLLAIIENSSESPITSKSILAVRVLTDVLNKLRTRTEVGSCGDYYASLCPRVISLVLHLITLLVKPLFDLGQADATVFQEVENLFNLLLLFTEGHCDLVVLVLGKIGSFIDYLVDINANPSGKEQVGQLGHENVDSEREDSTARTQLLMIVKNFLVTFLENLNEADAITAQVFNKLKLIIERAHQCRLFDCYSHTIFSLLLHSQIIRGCLENDNKESCNVDRNQGMHNCSYLIEHEIFTLECAKRMLTERFYWPAYKAGTYAACQGAWVTSTFIFGQLVTKLQSDSCSSWLKSLAQFAYSEGQIQLSLLPQLETSLIDWLQMKECSSRQSGDSFGEIERGGVGNFNEPDYSEALFEAYHGINSSAEILESIIKSGDEFCFQRWFLLLRAKLLSVVTDIFKTLGSTSLNQDNNYSDGQVLLFDSLYQITELCTRLMKLAQEFDLFATSFIGMDSKSLKVIGALALSSSLLAFTTGFALFIPNLPACDFLKNCTLHISQNSLPAMLIQNLVARLWHIDSETSVKLSVFLEVVGPPKNCFHLPLRNQILDSGGKVKDILSLCSYAVSGVVCLQNEANTVCDKELLARVTKNGLELLLTTIMKWMHIPFRIPKSFSKLRPCIGSELFVASAETRNPKEITVSPGSHLSLNLCLQLKNVPPNLPFQLTKLYCILHSSESFHDSRSTTEDNEQTRKSNRPWETENLVEMNEKLWRYVTDCADKKIKHNIIRKEGKLANVFVRFQANDRGQGFSNCLLDVSRFPAGSHRIQWHSCCIDSRGNYWSLLPLNAGPVFTIQ